MTEGSICSQLGYLAGVLCASRLPMWRVHLIAPDYGIVWLIGTRDDQTLGCVFQCFEAQLHGVEAAIGLATLAIASPIGVVSSPGRAPCSRIGCLLLPKPPVLRAERHAVAYRQARNCLACQHAQCIHCCCISTTRLVCLPMKQQDPL